jgi:flavin reductase (DIM6/NTAB) family NADH-FMN oxidoreductase RutF
MQRAPLHITRDTINTWEKSYRTQFINSLPGYKSANLIGTQDADGLTNLAIFSSVTHLGSHPPLLSFFVRPDAVPRHTLNNIQTTGYYTINHINTEQLPQAHQTSARYPQGVSEFEATGLPLWHSEAFFAPYVASSRVKIGLQLRDILFIPTNQCQMVIGEVQEVFINPDALAQDGHIRLTDLDSLCIGGLDAYHRPQHLSRWSYAKVGKPLRRID